MRLPGRERLGFYPLPVPEAQRIHGNYRAFSQLSEMRFVARVNRLVREWVGAKLEMQDLARRSFTTFRVKRSASAVGCPQSFSLPASVWIVDPAVHPFRIESHGIRDTKHNKLPGVGQQRE